MNLVMLSSNNQSCTTRRSAVLTHALDVGRCGRRARRRASVVTVNLETVEKTPECQPLNLSLDQIRSEASNFVTQTQ